MKKRIVVTGLGCISPLGNTVDATWDGISHGKSGITRITKFDATDYRSQIAGEVKGFDTTGVIDPKELKKMDEFIHYAIVAADQALKDANLTISDELAPKVGVSVGIGIGGLMSIEKYHTVLLESGPRRITPFFIPMVISNMASGYISIMYNCKGYTTSTVSACSSSNHSIGDAARIIERGDATVMIVGGAEAVVCPLAIGGFSAMKALSQRNDEPAKASRPYDRDRDGFVLGEGAGILILEEYEFAKARGAKIYGELAGYGFSSDANHITSPTTDGPLRAMKMALDDAGVNADQVDYVNAHGTSTPVGDINELKAMKMLMGDAAKKVSISSSKSMSGHLLGAAGALEAVVSLKSMQHNLVPPTINVDNLDPECDLDVTPNKAKERKLNVVMSNSFGFGGTNATLVFKRV
ncbi:MAG: beta-ketoacyl-ACP synthase II [Deltaproteobacteria bacterium]|nr:beta-ketoacyl-ACP synthase II [Deltaproteobacteria bacterium]MDH4122036.1 beta-ketoacyl-ACP synthase II [Deltaproteobacteria bacterium]